MPLLWARGLTAYEERRPNKAHSPFREGPVGLLGKWLQMPGSFQCWVLMWDCNLKLLILYVQKLVLTWNRGLSRRDLLGHPSRKVSEHPGRLCEAYGYPISGALCHPLAIVPEAANLCLSLHLPPQHSLQYSGSSAEHTTYPGTHPQKENANSSVASFQNKFKSAHQPHPYLSVSQ